jgi:hypothetical protein
MTQSCKTHRVIVFLTQWFSRNEKLQTVLSLAQCYFYLLKVHSNHYSSRNEWHSRHRYKRETKRIYLIWRQPFAERKHIYISVYLPIYKSECMYVCVYVCSGQHNYLSMNGIVPFPSFTWLCKYKESISREKCGILPKGPKYLRKYVCSSLAVSRQQVHDSYPWKPTMRNCW